MQYKNLLLILAATFFIIISMQITVADSNLTTGLDYNVVIKDNGQAINLITIKEEGNYSIIVPFDSKIEAKGVLYIINMIDSDNKEVLIYKGDKKKGIVGYTTDSYTIKAGNEWVFDMNNNNNVSNVNIIFPKRSEFMLISSNGLVDENKIFFKDANNILVKYKSNYGDINTDTKFYKGFFYIVIVIAAISFTSWGVFYFRKKSVKTLKTSAKENIIKTLAHNERKIIRHLLEENDCIMKRNLLERKSGISKSSLANSLNNLDKKEIIKIDKTFTIHKVELTDWFKKL